MRLLSNLNIIALSLAVVASGCVWPDVVEEGNGSVSADDDTTSDDDADNNLVACADPGACDDNDPCTRDNLCNLETGECVHTLNPAGTACDDTDACTLNDACDGTGLCTGTPKECPATTTQCQVAECVEGECIDVPNADVNGTTCDDGEVCGDGVCDSGTCTHVPWDCGESDVCMVRGCGAKMYEGGPDRCVAIPDVGLAECAPPVPVGCSVSTHEDGCMVLTCGESSGEVCPMAGTPGASCAVETLVGCTRVACDDGTTSDCLPTTPAPVEGPSCSEFGVWAILPEGEWQVGIDGGALATVIVDDGERLYGATEAREVRVYLPSDDRQGIKCVDHCGGIFDPPLICGTEGCQAVCGFDRTASVIPPTDTPPMTDGPLGIRTPEGTPMEFWGPPPHNSLGTAESTDSAGIMQGPDGTLAITVPPTTTPCECFVGTTPSGACHDLTGGGFGCQD